MQDVLDFLTALAQNNNREWFAANKEWYHRSYAQFEEFVGLVINGITCFDEDIAGQTPRSCIYRIYRDIRFSPDKSPYKTWMGAYMVVQGRKSGFAGYYLHIAPTGTGLLDGNYVIAGSYMPTSVELRSIREDIIDNGEQMLDAIATAEKRGFTLERHNSLTRNPKDFPPTGKFDDLLRLRDFDVVKQLSNEQLMAADAIEKIVADFRATKPFVDILNRSIRYAREEMM